MEVVAATGDEVVIQVLLGRWSAWVLFLHNADQLIAHFIHLVSGKQVRHLKVAKSNLTTSVVVPKCYL